MKGYARGHGSEAKKGRVAELQLPLQSLCWSAGEGESVPREVADDQAAGGSVRESRAARRQSPEGVQRMRDSSEDRDRCQARTVAPKDGNQEGGLIDQEKASRPASHGQ